MSGFVDKFKNMWSPPEDEYEYDNDDVQQEDVASNQDEPDVYDDDTTNRNFAPNNKKNVLNMRAKEQLQVALFKPEHFGEETRSIADELLKMHTVVLNLENSSKDVSRRIIDFISGVAYANGGKIKRVATSTFIITPYNVDFTGDNVLDEVENNDLYF